ncbi:hypothetical protein QWY81_06285 [Polaribacter undariae]|uniref:Uncharacterized protein n=1 Tax=Polaribacter sejongensis TaxID=985043 RepID=A0AAJ1VGB2_9FLAO|nr:hypothetical protein [Polaribacter undariae]MDN3619064.1 hypothetical protein [Polaribacter undariae]UWD33150.1 hypothetical protein NQP51_05575 [Polaribacter undariae]
MENKIKNSEEYLNSILGKKNSFSLPKNYFDTIEDAVETKLAEENLTKENGFATPDNYFKNLEDNILSKVSAPKKEAKVISFKERILKIIPIAAAASIILFIGLNSFEFNKTEELTIDSLSDDDMEFWLNSTTIHTNDIAIVLENDLLEESDFYFSSLEDENIEDYINSIDNTSFFNEIN